MRDELISLSGRIQSDLVDLDRTRDLVLRKWQKALTDEDYLGSVAFDLQSFHQGVERIFEGIAKLIDGAVPSGENWHQMLLEQMTEEVPGIRPAVISPETKEAVDDLRRFRHVARNIYGFNIKPAKISNLVDKLPEATDRIRNDLSAFAQFLRQ